jgi:hypothetical protein
MTDAPAVFNQPGAAFVLLPDGIKFPPVEKEWPNKPHTFAQAQAHKGNVGILAGNGYIGLDQDDPDAFQGLDLPATTTWETRPGRLGMWLICDDCTLELLAKYGKKADHAQFKLFKDGRSCGEVKLQRTYQVIPNSWKKLEDGKRADYKMLDSSPPAKISLAKLLEDLQNIGITFSSKLDQNAARLEEMGKKANQKRAENDEARTRRYAEAALRDEVLTLAGSPDGNRNDQLNRAAFAMGQFVAAKVLSEGEVVSELSRAATNTGLDSDEIRKTIMSGLESGNKHPRLIPEKAQPNSTGPKVAPADILERIKADPRALKDPATLAALAALKANDPIEYDLLLESIKKVGTGIKVATINELVDKCILESEKAAEKPIEAPAGIREKAQAIAERGDPFKFLIWQAQRNHLGDIDYQKVLIASIASAASQTSNGIQPGGNGDKGSGKSDACAATYHLVPMDRRLDGSLSPMSLFYLQTTGRLQPGMILFSDDVEYEPIIPIYKRSTARFQQGITHFSVTGGKTREAIELKIPPRMVWWLTAVESVANEQAFDRQYPISTDSSPTHKQRVSREIADRRARKELRLAEDEGIEVARQIIADIFDNGPFKVLVPQSTKSEWLKVADFRGQEQFWDLVDALVILRWRQHQREADGWLVAEDKDLIEAKGILTGHKVAHFADLTEAEAKLVGVMSSGRSMTQKELTEALSVAQSTLSERLRSIMAKSAIITEDIDQGKKVYALNPKMNLGTIYWAGIDLINLKIDDGETYRSQKIALSGCYRYVIGLPIGIIINNNNRIPSSLSVNVGESIERDTCSCKKCLGWKESIPSSSILISPKHYDNDRKQQQAPLSDTDKSPAPESIRTDNASSGHVDIPIRQAVDTLQPSTSTEEQTNAKEEHFRDQAEKHIDPKKPNEGNPGFQKFKAGMKKRTCCLCGRAFPYDLTPYFNNGQSGYICVSCHMGGKPPEPVNADSHTQTELEKEEAQA